MLSPVYTLRLPHRLHHGHEGPPGRGLRGCLRPLFCSPRQRCHGQPGDKGTQRDGQGVGGLVGWTAPWGMLWGDNTVGATCRLGKVVGQE